MFNVNPIYFYTNVFKNIRKYLSGFSPKGLPQSIRTIPHTQVIIVVSHSLSSLNIFLLLILRACTVVFLGGCRLRPVGEPLEISFDRAI